LKIVFDTDVLYAALKSPTGASRLWLGAALSLRVVPVMTTALWLEYEAVLNRPKSLADMGASRTDVGLVLDRLANVALPVDPEPGLRPAANDPDDDFAVARRFGFEISTPGAALARYRALLEGE
jgi:predicted nucleic acid-binding protein